MSCNTRINPKTNRCVLSKGLVGKHIRGRPKLCRTVRNPETNRCVYPSSRKKSKPKGKSKKKSNQKNQKNQKKSKKKTPFRKDAQRNQSKINPICVPAKFKTLADSCLCNADWKRKGKVGSGAFGKVYQVCKVKDCKYVMKVQKFDKYGKAELEAYMSLQGTRLTPKLFAAWTCKGYLYLVMEQVFPCSATRPQLVKRVASLLDKLQDKGWIHGDVHDGNVMCTSSGRTVLIDFGFAVQKGKHPYANQRNRTWNDMKKLQNTQLDDFDDSSTST